MNPVKIIVLEKLVMHGPEFILGRSSFRGFGRQLSVWVHRSDGQVSIDVAHPVAHSRLQFSDVVIDLSTVGTLIVAIFNQRRQGVNGPL
jgi:hypothetical protein